MRDLESAMLADEGSSALAIQRDALIERCVELRAAEIKAAGFTSGAACAFAAAEERRWIARHITEVGS